MIYLDMDGVLCNFLKGASIVTSTDLESHRDWEKVRDFAWDEINKGGSDFWAGLEWLPDGKLLWEYLKKKQYAVRILSAYPAAVGNREFAKTGKRSWILEHLNRPLAVNAIFCHVAEKQNYARPGHILIDDNMKTIHQWSVKGGKGILHVDVETTIRKLKHYESGSKK